MFLQIYLEQRASPFFDDCPKNFAQLDVDC